MTANESEINQNNLDALNEEMSNYLELIPEAEPYTNQDQILELQSEIKYLKQDYLKLQEAISNKDNIINEFHNVSEITKNKFKILEDTNLGLRHDNQMLLEKLDEYQNEVLPQIANADRIKEKKLTELKNLNYKLEKQVEELKFDLIKNEESIRSKFGEQEENMRRKSKEREENLKSQYMKEILSANLANETFRMENEKLKMEIRSLKNKIEDIESQNVDKDSEHKGIIQSKEKECDKLKRRIKEIENEIDELELKLKDKENESNLKLKSYEDNINKIQSQITVKDKRIKDLDGEINNLKSIILDLEHTIEEFEIKSENKDKVIEQLKNQNSEILREFNNKELEINQFEQGRSKEIDDFVDKFNELVTENTNLQDENEELRANLFQASEKLRELNDLIIDKYEGLELNYFKEKNNKDNLEKKFNSVIRKMKDKEKDLINELECVRILLEKKEEELENVRLKYKNKIQVVS